MASGKGWALNTPQVQHVLCCIGPEIRHVPVKTLSNWARDGVLVPSAQYRQVRGADRLYTVEDVIAASVLLQLRRVYGLSLVHAQKIIRHPQVSTSILGLDDFVIVVNHNTRGVAVLPRKDAALMFNTIELAPLRRRVIALAEVTLDAAELE